MPYDALFALYLLFLPLFSQVDLETDVTPVIDFINDGPSLSEQPGKQTPLIVSILPIPFSLMLALYFSTAIDCSYSDA